MIKGIYKTSTVSRLTGFRPGVLRAWERRFGLLEPGRSAGGHRMYTEDDLRVLLHVRTQLDAGRAIGEVAAQGRAALVDAGRDLAFPDPQPQAAVTSGRSNVRRLRPAGLVPHKAELAACKDALVAAAVDIDPRAVDAALQQAFSLVDSERAVRDVLVPAVRAVGLAWELGTCSVAGEHLLTAAVQGQMSRLLHHALLRVPNDAPAVLSACFPGDEHALPGLLLAWELARAGLRVTFLGTGLPLTDLEVAIAQLAPHAVVMTVTLSSLWAGSHDGLREVLDRHPAVPFFVGGAGAPRADAELEPLGLRLHSESLAEVLTGLVA